MSSPGRFPLGLQRRIGRQRLRRIVLGAIPFVALATLWQMNALYGWLAPIHVPPPAAVWNAIFALQEGCPGVIDALRQSPSCLFTNHALSSMGRVISVDYESLPALVSRAGSSLAGTTTGPPCGAPCRWSTVIVASSPASGGSVAASTRSGGHRHRRLTS